MISNAIKKEVTNRLRSVEKEHGVTVLYAVESGSRAWGFASPNSDYDVRFVYLNTRDWYLSLEENRDVIEYPIVDDFDLNGWDVRKALRLFKRSNPSLMEWLYSPVVYFCDGRFAPALRQQVTKHYSTARSVHHYMSMAKTNYRGYLCEPVVPMKKYFYVLRPILAATWVERFGTMPPIAFSELLGLLDDKSNLFQEIQELIARKLKATEKEMIPIQPALNAYIETELTRLAGFNQTQETRYSSTVLDQVFRSMVA